MDRKIAVILSECLQMPAQHAEMSRLFYGDIQPVGVIVRGKTREAQCVVEGEIDCREFNVGDGVYQGGAAFARGRLALRYGPGLNSHRALRHAARWRGLVTEKRLKSRCPLGTLYRPKQFERLLAAGHGIDRIQFAVDAAGGQRRQGQIKKWRRGTWIHRQILKPTRDRPCR